MAYDEDELRTIIESRLSQHGIDVSSYGPSLALEMGQKIQALANELLQAVVRQAIALKTEEVLEQARGKGGEAEARESFSKIRRAIDAIETGKTQVDILKALLTGVTDFCPRVALFIVKGDKGIGWLAQGFGTTPPFTDENIKKVSVPLTADTFFRNVYNACVTYNGPGDARGDNGKFFERIGGFVPREVQAVPLVIKGKVVAILYGDGGSEVAELSATDVSAAFVQVAAMSIKLIPLKTRPEESGDSSGRLRAVTDSGGFARPVTESTPRPMPSPVAAPAARSSAIPVAPARPAPAPPPVPAAPAPAPPSVPADVAPEEKKLHDEAKRFARLLVSEIKLYNEAKVAVGRRNRDLYERLKEDIERSRQMYNERYPAKITSTTNYFFEELVAQLADGDRSALGI